MTWPMRITKREATFQDLQRVPPNMVSLDAKVRSALGEHLVDDGAARHAKPATELKRKREELWHKGPPEQNPGLRMLYAIRRF